MSEAKIKMRISKNENAECSSCGDSKEKVLDMFDICIGNDEFCICDRCMGVLFQKALKASCMVNNRLKSKHDLAVISRRKRVE